MQNRDLDQKGHSQIQPKLQQDKKTQATNVQVANLGEMVLTAYLPHAIWMMNGCATWL